MKPQESYKDIYTKSIHYVFYSNDEVCYYRNEIIHDNNSYKEIDEIRRILCFISYAIFSLSGDGICFEFRTIIEMMYDTSCQF